MAQVTRQKGRGSKEEKKRPTLSLEQQASRGFLDSTLILPLCDQKVQENVKGPVMNIMLKLKHGQ